MTKERLTQLFNQYKRTDTCYLWQVYGRYSRAKERAFNNWYQIMSELEGWHMRIVNYNSQMFTLGFMTHEEGKTIFNYITSYNHYKLDVTGLI